MTFKLKEHFDDLTNWSKDIYVVAANSEVSSTGNDNQAYRALPEIIPSGGVFRFDARFKVIDGSGTDDGYLGLNTGTAGVKAANTSWLSVGYTPTSGICAFYATALGGAGITTLIPSANVVIGNYYRVGIVSDGKTVSFWVSHDDGTNLAVIKAPAPTVAIKNAFINFNRISGISVDKIGVINDFDGYDDVLFNERMRFYTYTIIRDESERAFIEIPETYNKLNKRRLVIFTHGSSGNPENFINGYDSERTFRSQMVTQGYIFAVSHAYGNNWGNKKVIGHNRLLRDFLQANFNCFYKGFIVGQSMGGHGACLTAMTYPHMFAAIGLIYPSLNLDWMYQGLNSSANYSSAINTAYGCDATSYERIAKGHNTHDRFDELFKFPLKAWHGDADITVGIKHAQDAVAAVTYRGGTASLITIVGAVHGSPLCFDPVAMATFFNLVSDANLSQPSYVKDPLQGAILLN